ncbi:abhydrolase domain-containing protein [Metarhizium acridum CQMa 102]|uniref:Abhydrolase domain-containing protein n=1 Tax=Metarhizium acridum (strain CQMa 102) TaxID=655827 RepID=E9EBH3_METAQ|nr:abhydrolase domain-containing protein [Metarhizium acridum CQMa 102]EFY86720.1 abhydrolase domain-containing protein [Metarhizium acridum CQMa 102]
MSKRPAQDSASQESKRKRYSPPTEENVASNIRVPGPIPAMFALTPWLSSDIPSGLPSIPKILDPELEATVFRHPGLSDPLRSYERLEWLGDAYLELIASSLIYQTFTSTPTGRCSQLREILIRNKTLAQYFREYGLESKAHLPSDLKTDISRSRGSSSDKDIIKTQADMFEAYVAAAIISDPENGMANTASWLKSLWARTIKNQILNNEKNRKLGTQPSSTAQGSTKDMASSSNLSAKERLRIEIGVKGVLIRYEDMPRIGKDRDLGLPLYTVGAYLDGWGERNKLLGTGTALGKKEAAQKAAQKALENKKLLKPYVAKKAAFMEATKAAEEA